MSLSEHEQGTLVSVFRSWEARFRAGSASAILMTKSKFIRGARSMR